MVGLFVGGWGNKARAIASRERGKANGNNRGG